MRKKLMFLLPAIMTLVSVARADVVKQVSLPANDIVYDHVSQKLFVTVPSSAGARGNSVTAIDPFTAAVGKSVFVGSEPQRVVATDDGKFLYIALSGSTIIRRFFIATKTPGQQFDLGINNGPNYAQDIATLPGQPNSIAVSRAVPGVSPHLLDIQIYDDGVARGQGSGGSNVIEFGATAGRMYGYLNELTSFDYCQYDVTSTGITRTAVLHPLSGANVDITYSGGRIYATNGQIFDAETGGPIAVFPGGNFCVDEGLKKIFVLKQNGSSATLEARSTKTFKIIDSGTIAGISGNAGGIVRFGPDGIAFRTDDGKIYLVQSHVVQPYGIKVQITRPNGSPLKAVSLNLSGDATLTGTTDENGVATFANLGRGTYKITPGLANFTFSPSNTPVTLPVTDSTGPNAVIRFTGQRTAFDIRGSIVNGANKPVGGQVIQIRNREDQVVGSTTSKADGTFLFPGFAAGFYVVVPRQDPGMNFSPTAYEVTLPDNNSSIAPDSLANFVRTIDIKSAYNVVFQSDRDGTPQVYLLRPGAAQEERLTTTSRQSDVPHFAPEGDRVYFDSDPGTGGEVFTIPLTGEPRKRITVGGSSFPAPSPDGKYLVFTSPRDTFDNELWYSKSDGSNPKRITYTPFGDYHPSWSPSSERIAYYLSLNGDFDEDIFTIRPDGSDRVQLTTTQNNQDPNYSPDGSQIVFTSWRDGNREIYLMNADGTNQHRLTNNPASDGQACWSPDGKYLFFASDRAGNFDIYRMRPDGSDVAQITTAPSNDSWPTVASLTRTTFKISGRVLNGKGAPVAGQTLELENQDGVALTTAVTAADGTYVFAGLPEGPYIVQPILAPGYAFSPSNQGLLLPVDGTGGPDGTANFIRTVVPPASSNMVFSSTRDGNEEIYLLKPDQTAPVRLTNNGARDRFPNLSPDGTKIVFSSNRFGNATNDDIFVMNVDGSGLVRLTTSTADEIFPQWSPDGTKILYSDNRNELDYDIYIMDADGTNSHLVASNPDRDMRPTWSPDGSKIAFYGSLNTVPDTNVYVAPASGSGPLTPITSSNRDFDPQWSPDGSHIIFSSTRDGHSQLYLIDPDGENEVNLSKNNYNEATPAWSPDGSQIYFRSDRDGNLELYRMKLDGSGLVRLTNNPAEDSYPSVRPVPTAPATGQTPASSPEPATPSSPSGKSS